MSEADYFIENFAKPYAKQIAEGKTDNLADALFKSEYIHKRIRDKIWEVLEEIGLTHPPGSTEDSPNYYDWSVEEIGWDDYDCSIELYGVKQNFTFTSSQIKSIEEIGFSRIYVNYKDDPRNSGRSTPAQYAHPVVKDLI